MSVQAGVWNFDGAPASAEAIAKISETIAQYGPDGESTYFGGPIGMLYRPFHTTKESRDERQPFVSSRGSVFTWDGRLDNREVLLPQLQADLPSKQTDLAIVVAAFERWGMDCFQRLVGDWALAVWNPSQRVLTLGRDYIGVRQLYYYPTTKRVIWCTCLASLVLSGDSFNLDEEYVAGYLALYPDAHRTPYREIRAVPPGSFVSIRPSGSTVRSYWAFKPRVRVRYEADAEYEEHFRHVFRQAVRRRLRSDYPILADLSGGLDSSSIVCMADSILADEGAETPQLDTLSYYNRNEPQGDDWLYFCKVEEKRGKKGFHIHAGKFSLSFAFGAGCFPATPGSLGGYLECESERRRIMRNGGYRVTLSGLGGDELLGGVPDPKPQIADLVVQFRLLRLFRQLVAWSLVKRQPLVYLLLQALAPRLPPEICTRFLAQARVESWIGQSFARRTRLAIRQLGPLQGFGFWLPSRRDYARTVISLSHQIGNLQPPSMSGEEVRYPLLDQNLVEFLLAVPASQLLRPGERRSLLRRALKDYLPHEVLSRDTKGTTARSPLLDIDRHWHQLEGIFAAPLCTLLGFINKPEFLRALMDARNGNAPHLVRLLRAVSLELWLRQSSARSVLAVPETFARPGTPSLTLQRDEAAEVRN